MGEGLVAAYSDKDFKLAKKKIKCPLHHMVKPGHLPYKIKPNPLMQHWSADVCKEFKLRKWVYELDAFGNKIPDYNNHYQPEISAAYAREHIYSLNRPICLKCRRCIQ